MVYVDQIREYPHTKIRGCKHKKWCHLFADSKEELLEFGKKIGLKAEWFQGNHFDLTPKKRELAIQNGAVEMSVKEWMRRTFPDIRRFKNERLAKFYESKRRN